MKIKKLTWKKDRHLAYSAWIGKQRVMGLAFLNEGNGLKAYVNDKPHEFKSVGDGKKCVQEKFFEPFIKSCLQDEK